jgi:anti-sigma regulatory factor (Ser/Thr protein kinase)
MYLLIVPESPVLSAAELVLNGDLAELGRLAAAVGRFCRESSLGEDVELDVNLAIEELFVNSVQHGGCAGMSDAVRIRIAKGNGGVDIEYADRGTAFDPALVPAPDYSTPIEKRPQGGFGLHLAQQVMESFEYRRSEGWNRITMRRRVNS